MAEKVDLVPKLGAAFMAYATTAYGMRNAPNHPYIFGALAGAAAYATVDSIGGKNYAPWAGLGAVLPILLTLGVFQRLGISGLGGHEVVQPQYIPPVRTVALGYPRMRARRF